MYTMIRAPRSRETSFQLWNRWVDEYLCKTVITAAGFLRFHNGVSFDEKKEENYENDHLKSERDNDTNDNDWVNRFYFR